MAGKRVFDIIIHKYDPHIAYQKEKEKNAGIVEW